jgi:hypothetical protein
MQSRVVSFRVRPPTRRSRLHCVSTLLACLGFAACALNTRPGDGLVTDGLTQDRQFAATPPGGGAGGGRMGGAPDGKVMRTCKNAPLFIQHAIPRFVADCVECHDGTKLKAVFVFDLIDGESTEMTKLAETCNLTLTANVTYEERLQSPLFTEVDPARTDLEHDFKYPDAASFAAFRDAVMLWLQTE